MCIGIWREVIRTLTTEEFADRFMGTTKAPGEVRGACMKHLALLVGGL